MTQNILGNFIATGIGSLPYTEPDYAVELIISKFSEIPFWPQLPKRGLNEGMGGQYIGKLPGIEINREKASFFINTSLDHSQEMEIFFQNYLDSNFDYFKIEKDYSAGLYRFLEILPTLDRKDMKFLKGHITGPITFGSLVKDETGKDIIHNDIFYDCVIKNLAMTAAWQVEVLKQFDLPVIIFMDEPSMVSFGSAYSTLAREQVLNIWNEVIDIIHNAGGITAIHCCGNTDWGLLFESNCDIVNFDSYEFFDKMMLYVDDLKKFIAKGKKIAWGAVPTDERISKETVGSLKKKIDEGVQRLIKSGISQKALISSSILTPSCGMGTLDITHAEQVTTITAELSKMLKKEYAS